MEKSHLIDILLRYQLHYLAHEICKFMEFPNSKRLISKIYVDWAKCKIENYDSDKPDEPLVKAIQERFEGEDKTLISFTDIA